jgi:hypothetical protein
LPGNSAEYRKANPTYAERNRKLNMLRTKALRELAKRYPEEFQAIFEDLKREADVDGQNSRTGRG